MNEAGGLQMAATRSAAEVAMYSISAPLLGLNGESL
jgi:hypothetical protein